MQGDTRIRPPYENIQEHNKSTIWDPAQGHHPLSIYRMIEQKIVNIQLLLLRSV